MSERPPSSIDVEKSFIKMTPVRLAGIIIGVVTLALMGAGKVSSMATNNSVDHKIEHHSVRPHPVTETRVQAVELKVAAQETKNSDQDTAIAKLEGLPRQLGNVESKLDILIMQQLDQPGRDRDAMQKAARKKRRAVGVRAGSARDPLIGIDGL